MWRKSVEKVGAGELTKAQAGQLQDILRDRIEHLKPPEAKAAPQDEPVDAEIVEDEAPRGLDPEDPWMPAIEALASAEDAETLLADMVDQLGLGELDPERAKLIEQAVDARFPQAAREAA